jgi:hypothetical protein
MISLPDLPDVKRELLRTDRKKSAPHRNIQALKKSIDMAEEVLADPQEVVGDPQDAPDPCPCRQEGKCWHFCTAVRTSLELRGV